VPLLGAAARARLQCDLFDSVYVLDQHSFPFVQLHVT